MSTTTLAKAGTKNAEQVILLDASTGDPASLGGGVQYADGTAAATPTGTVAMFDDAGTMTAVSDTNPLPVSATIDTTGLATSAKQDTGNTSVASIDSKTPALGQALAAASVPVVLTAAQVTTLTPPAAITGFATSAKQDTIIGHVDGIETLLTAIDGHVDGLETSNSAIQTSVELIDDAIKADDAAFTPATTKVMMAGFEFDDSSPDSVDEGDAGAARMSSRREQYMQIRDAAGNERGANVNASGQLAVAGPVTNAGTFAVQVDGSALTSLQLIDDPVQVLGTDTYTEATSKGITLGAVRRDADTTLVNTTNEFTPLQTDARGLLKVEAFSGETLPVSFTGSGDVATQTTLASLLTSSQLIDDMIYTDDTSTHATGTSKGALIMAAATPTDTAVNANDIGAVGMTNNREMYVSLRDISGAAAVTGSGNATGALRVEVANNGTGLITANPATAANWGVYVEDAGETAGGNLSMAGTVRRDTQASSAGTTGDNATLNTDSTGGLWIAGNAIEDAGETAGGALVMAGAVRRDSPASSSGTTGDNSTINVDALGKLWVTGSYVEDVGHTAADTLIAVATRRIDTAASSSGTSGDYSTLDSSAEGAVWATLTPTTTSGCTIFRSLDIDETEEDIKTSAGNVYAIYFGNATSSIRYLKFYNATAANTTVGSTTPVLTFLIPASSAGWLSLPYAISFGTAICVACTTGVADADTGAPGANDVVINVLYK